MIATIVHVKPNTSTNKQKTLGLHVLPKEQSQAGKMYLEHKLV